MERNLNLYGKKVKGKLFIYNKEEINEWLKNISEDEDIIIKLRPQKDYKSHRQVRLIYHCFRQISDKTGYTVEEVKTMMKLYQGLCGTHTIEDKDITFCKSISDMTKKELSEFIIKTDQWANKNLDLVLLSYDDIKFLKN